MVQGDWFARLLINSFDYLIIIVPGAALVYSVKRKLCFKSVQQSRLVQIFVYGLEDGNFSTGDVESQVPMLEDGKNEAKVKTIEPPPNRMRQAMLLMYCFAGLQSSYLIWGLLQEKLMTTEYIVTSSQNESHAIKFRDSQFLVLVNRVLALFIAIVALIVIRLRRKTPMVQGRAPYVIAPLYEFAFCSLSNVLSSWCQYEALKFVNFPTQVLSKACKILPVMLMSQVIGGKKYKTHEYVCALSISLGMSLFLYGNHQSLGHGPSHTGESYSLFDGLLILALYLTFDSFTSNWQGKLFEKYRISTWQMMAAVNMYSILFTSSALSQQGDLLPSLRTVLSSFQLTRDCMLLSIFSATGQLFIFYTIAQFGALVFIIIMTLRQAFAIILSCIIYGHPLGSLALFGIFIVFMTLFTQLYWKANKGRAK